MNAPRSAPVSVPLSVSIEGVGAWAPGLTNWNHVRAWLQGEAPRAAKSPARPGAGILPAAERRRAPASVLHAVEVASQATNMAALDPASLPCVFAAAHGDVAILDDVCDVLAHAPTELSPTRFHNSVHNAAAGYWTIANQCRAASTALCALEYNFGASLLEAAVQACADQRPVLLVVSDVAGVGPLREVIASTEPFACALVLAPQASARGLATCSIRLQARTNATPVSGTEPATLAAANLAARGLVLLQALAMASPAVIMVDAGPELSLAIDMEWKP